MDYDWNVLRGKLQEILDEDTAAGRECGCQLVIYQHGRKVIDLCSGYTDREKKIPINNKHLFPIFSSGKAVLAAAVLQAMDRGYFTCDTPLADLWPGFGVENKGGITIEHALSHRAGLHIMPRIENLEELANWDLMCTRIAESPARSLPGKRCAYHAVTFAFVAGMPLVCVYGKPLGEVLKENILVPCGVDKEFYFGLDDEAAARCVDIVDADDVTDKPSWCVRHMNNQTLRRGCIPSFNGCSTANGLARFYAALSGDIPGAEIVAPETLAYATSRPFRDPEDIPPANSWTSFGLGLVLWDEPGVSHRIFGHGGAGGAEGFYDKSSGIALGFVKNCNIKNHPEHIVRDRFAELLGFPIRHW